MGSGHFDYLQRPATRPVGAARPVGALGMTGFFDRAPTDRRSWAAMRDRFDATLQRA